MLRGYIFRRSAFGGLNSLSCTYVGWPMRHLTPVRGFEVQKLSSPGGGLPPRLASDEETQRETNRRSRPPFGGAQPPGSFAARTLGTLAGQSRPVAQGMGQTHSRGEAAHGHERAGDFFGSHSRI